MTQRRIYQNEFPYFITFRTRGGAPLFEDEKYVDLMLNVIFKTCIIKHFEILAFQIMVDHIHLLVNQKYTAPTAGCGGKTIIIPQAQPAVVARPFQIFTISDVIHGIKSYFIKEIRTNYNISYSIWQPRFYVRIVSTCKYLGTVIEYIKYNPIKAKLPVKYCKLPYQYLNMLKINNLF